MAWTPLLGRTSPWIFVWWVRYPQGYSLGPRGICNPKTYPYISSSNCPHTPSLSNAFWTGSNTTLVPLSINELNKIFNTRSFTLPENHNLVSLREMLGRQLEMDLKFQGQGRAEFQRGVLSAYRQDLQP